MGQIVCSLKQERTGAAPPPPPLTPKDDVTQSPLSLLYISPANSPSNSDEPSMSSSIIETTLVQEERHSVDQHVGELAVKIIPKRAWSGYHLFQLSNIKGSSPRLIRTPKIRPKVKREEDMDQLITMMKNHTVSDDVPFDFNFTKPLTPQNSPQAKKPEFKFSFTAPYHGYIPEQGFERQQQEKQKDYNDRLSNRKILPLPKPRLLKSSNIPLPANNNIVFNTVMDTNSIDRDNKKKMKCSDSLKTSDNNKRKERNWKDSFISNEFIHKTPDTSSSIGKLLNTKKIESKKIPMITASVSMTTDNNNNSSNSNNNNTNTNNKKTTKKKVQKKQKNKPKQKNKEEMAPGGFLSSDINLFENPISDDWICLFCQYDILFNGIDENRKKNYRRKKEKSKRNDSEEDL